MSRARASLGPRPVAAQPLVLTVGHSTRTLDAFLELLRRHRVEMLVDVRTLPASRRMPHFALTALKISLPEHGMAYRHMPELGGLRKPRPDSINTGWRNASFRGYADYMQTLEFRNAIDELSKLAKDNRVAIMCAEAVPWRCHRSLIGDALTAMGGDVRHITGPGAAQPHRMTPHAVVDRGGITYPPPDRLPL